MRLRFVLSFFGWLVEVVFLSFVAVRLFARGQWIGGIVASVYVLAGIAVTLLIIHRWYYHARSPKSTA